jgi:hypothetical protein
MDQSLHDLNPNIRSRGVPGMPGFNILNQLLSSNRRKLLDYHLMWLFATILGYGVYTLFQAVLDFL